MLMLKENQDLLGQFHVAPNLDFMRELPDGSIDIIVTSPPYNLGMRRRYGREYPEKCFSGKVSSVWKSAALRDGHGDAHNDALPYAEYYAWQQAVISECWRLLTDEGALWYNHKPRIQEGKCWMPHELIPEGIPLRQTIIWNRRSSGMNFNHRHFASNYEMILLIAKPKFRLTPGATTWGDIWDILPDRDQSNPHPAPFPIALPRRAIAATQHRPEAVVFDPHSGSGTTAMAAWLEGCRWLGCDKSAEYVEFAQLRLAHLQRQRQHLKAGSGSSWSWSSDAESPLPLPMLSSSSSRNNGNGNGNGSGKNGAVIEQQLELDLPASS
jgi:site-specific DNA-methyltransferase (adenine-specific)